MTGEDLRSWREELDVSIGEFAAALEVEPAQIEEWEDQRELKTSTGRALKLAIWEVKRDRLMAAAGIPSCPWIDGGKHSLQEIGRHVEDCATCQERAEFVDAHVPPAPAPPGLVAGITHFGESLPGWKSSAFFGGMLLVYMTGIGAPIIIVRGILARDLLFALGAFPFLGLLFLSGAAGGVVHYHTTRLRSAGRRGYYASWMLVVYAYLVAVGTMFYLGELAMGAEQHKLDPADGATWMSFGVLGAVFGAVVGYAARDRKNQKQAEQATGVTGV